MTERRAVNLRRQTAMSGKADLPPELQPAPITGLAGSLPIPSKQLVLSGSERKILTSLGWKDGDPIPSNLPALVQAAVNTRAVMDQDTQKVLTDLGKVQHKLEMPREVELNKLNPQHRAELEEAIAQARGAFKVLPEPRPPANPFAFGDYTPSVRAAMADNAPSIELVSPNKAPDPGTLPTGGLPPVDPPPMDPPPVPEAAPPFPGGSQMPVTPPVVTPADRLLYVQSILGGRFYREYEFFGGRLKASFRTLLVKDNDRCLAQCAAETADGKLRTIDDFYRRYFDYRLCLSLHELTVNDAPVDISSSVDEILRGASPGDGSVLPEILQQLQEDEVLQSESLWRLLGTAGQEFNRLVLAIEKESREPNFWLPIVG